MSEHPTHSAQHHASKFTSRQRTIALVIVAMAFVMDLLDNTIVNIAIPSIRADLGASYSTIQWLIAGYALSFATLLITGGRMGDVFGYKKLFLIGVGGFTFASLLSGVAWSPEILIVARLLQGAMAALMVPQVMSLMQIMYKPNERGPIMGIFGALAGVAASLGPVVGGILIHFNIAGLEWRPIFLINIPIGVIVIFFALRFLPEGKSPHPLKLDIFGTFLIMIAMFLLVFPLIQGRELDWPAWIFVVMATSIPVLILFGWWQTVKEKKDNSPLIVPGLLKIKSFVSGLLVNISFEGAMIGFFLPFTLLLQIGLGYDVIEAALTGIPTAIGISLTMAIVAQKLIPILGRYTIVLGTVVMALGLGVIFYMLHTSGANTSPWQFIPGLLLVGAGMANIMAPMFSVVLSDVDPKNAGSASGVLNAVQQLGGAIGTALIGVVFFGALVSNAPASFESVEPQIRSSLASAQLPAQAVDGIVAASKVCYVDTAQQKDETQTPDSCKALQATNQQNNLPQSTTDAIQSSLTSGIKDANTNNFINAFGAAVTFELVILAVVVGLSFLLPRHINPEAMEGAH